MEAGTSLGVFEVPELWRKSVLTVPEDGASVLFGNLEFDINAIPLHNPYATKDSIDEVLRLPSLDTFQYGPFGDQPTVYESSVVSTELEEIPEPDQAEEDIWLEIEGFAAVEKHQLSWDNFNNGNHGHRYQTPFLSECGGLVFNAAIEQAIKNSTAPLRQGPIAKADIVLKALLDMACGRSSVLYAWDEKQRTFRSLYQDMASTGLSAVALTSVASKMMDCGNTIRHLMRFADKTYASVAFPSKLAMANVILTVLSSIETHMSSQVMQIDSLLQLQKQTEKPTKLLRQMLQLLNKLRDAHTDEQASSAAYMWCHKTVEQEPWLVPVAREILSRVSTPLFQRISNWVGLTTETCTVQTATAGLSFIVPKTNAQEADAPDSDFLLSESDLPAFLSPDLGRTILETGSGLRLLQNHHRNHVLANVGTRALAQPLEWRQSWPDIDALLARAKDHEANLSSAVREYTTSIDSRQHDSLLPRRHEINEHKTKMRANFYLDIDQSIDELSQDPNTILPEPDRLTSLIRAELQAMADISCRNKMSDEPSLDMSCDLSFGPILYAQARLVRGACIRALFRQHNLQEHLSIQRSFQLMGDGTFITRLTAALFDTSAATTERQLGVMRSGHQMGLKLGQRSAWPPASSELRLALMGILTDCYTTSNTASASAARSQDLPGDLSFAIRNLSEDEVSRVLQSDSLYALDFLRLQYAAPSPIDSIITTSTIEKYDTIFKFLLKLARLTFVVSHLPRRNAVPYILSFANEVRHFVNVTVRYFFDTAIAEPWTAFAKHVDATAHALDEEDALMPPMMRDIGGIEDLRRRHHECLDAMLFGLLLRHRQQKVMAVLEEVYGQVLAFDALCRSDEPAAKAEVVKLQRLFTDRVVVLLDVCRGLSAKKAYGSDVDVAGQGGSVIERLVDAVDFNGFYASRRK